MENLFENYNNHDAEMSMVSADTKGTVLQEDPQESSIAPAMDLDTFENFLAAITEENITSVPFVISRNDTEEECAYEQLESKMQTIVELAEKQGVFDLGEEKLPIISQRKFFSICAGIRQNKNNSKSICMQFSYPDGTFSELFEFPQTDFIKAGRTQFQADHKKTKSIIDKFDNLLVSNIRSTLARYISREDSVCVMKDIFKNYEQLKVINTEPSISEVYSRIIAYIYRNKHDFHMFPYALNGNTFRIEKDQFERMLEELSYDNPTEILKLLKRHNMLHLPKSSVGYQAKVRINGDTVNCYCIKKLYISEKPNTNVPVPCETDVVMEKSVAHSASTAKAVGFLKI